MQGQGRLSELTEAPSLHPNIHCQMDGCSSEGCPCDLGEGRSGEAFGTWYI